MKGKHATFQGHEGVVEKGSADNKGRRLFVWHQKSADGTWHSHSTEYARALVEKREGRNLGRQFTVDHKDNDRMNDSEKNLHVMTNHDNIAKENQRRGREN